MTSLSNLYKCVCYWVWTIYSNVFLFCIMTVHQNTKNFFTKYTRYKRRPHNARMLLNSPNKKGVVRRLRIQTPRKPNSARRMVFKLWLTTRRHTVSSIKGSGHNLKRFSTVLIAGTGSRDLPGIYSHCIRGRFDLKGLYYKRRRRSIYGVPKHHNYNLMDFDWF